MAEDKKKADEPEQAPEPERELTAEEKRAAELAARPDPNIGIDGENPITPNNPPRGSQPVTSRPRD